MKIKAVIRKIFNKFGYDVRNTEYFLKLDATLNTMEEELGQLKEELRQLKEELILQKKKLGLFEEELRQQKEELGLHEVARLKKPSPLEQEYPYEIETNQDDLSNYKQNFYSAAQVVHKEPSAPYIPTYIFDGEYINKNHEYYNTCEKNGVCIDTGIEGFLQAEDALKIYELAYFSKGDILQLGTYKGLSTSIIIQAIRDGGGGRCETVDLSEQFTEDAKINLKKRYIEIKEVEFFINDGTLFIDSIIMRNKKYGFVFIDHWHGYNAVYTCAISLHKIMQTGGFVLFHDYLDKSNFEEHSIYGVYQAVHDALLIDDKFIYCGVFGCSALFRYVGKSD